MVIRRAVQADKGKIEKILRQRNTFTETEVQVALDVFEDALSHPAKRDYRIFCACDNADEVLGYICFGPIPLTEGSYDLYWIAVDENFWGTGIATKLLQSMENALQEEGARKVYIDTSSTPPYKAARSFYKSNGYAVVCVLTDFYRIGDDRVIFMKQIPNLVAPRCSAGNLSSCKR